MMKKRGTMRVRLDKVEDSSKLRRSSSSTLQATQQRKKPIFNIIEEEKEGNELDTEQVSSWKTFDEFGGPKRGPKKRVQTMALTSSKKKEAAEIPQNSSVTKRDMYLAKPEVRHTMAQGMKQNMSHLGEFGTENSLVAQLQAYYHHDLTEEELKLDWDMYSPQALMKRDMLRFDPQIRKLLLQLWQVTDRDHSGFVDRSEYIAMSEKLYFALVDDNKEEASRIAKHEWELDSFGHEKLDRDRFFQCWFQLADTWTEDISSGAYVAFLETILKCLTKVTGSEEGRATRVWREDGDILDFEQEFSNRGQAVEGSESNEVVSSSRSEGGGIGGDGEGLEGGGSEGDTTSLGRFNGNGGQMRPTPATAGSHGFSPNGGPSLDQYTKALANSRRNRIGQPFQRSDMISYDPNVLGAEDEADFHAAHAYRGLNSLDYYSLQAGPNTSAGLPQIMNAFSNEQFPRPPFSDLNAKSQTDNNFHDYYNYGTHNSHSQGSSRNPKAMGYFGGAGDGDDLSAFRNGYYQPKDASEQKQKLRVFVEVEQPPHQDDFDPKFHAMIMPKFQSKV
jgi:hypothetical protein